MQTNQPSINQAVQQRILDLCHQRGISICRLGALSGVTQSTVNDIVHGKTRSPNILTLKKLCDGLEMSITEFFDTQVFRNLEPEE